ncbi:hypothetical protein PR048_003594 [Dryococelus australis]|uniref:Uncharacterized protein n=1 Tax=Dryococelus australis TaxID=614101 RepID=A0ABQ9INL6_9NEOP|nr:hypothetical protein PR048_003594 [Dryococelus australis]
MLHTPHHSSPHERIFFHPLWISSSPTKIFNSLIFVPSHIWTLIIFQLLLKLPPLYTILHLLLCISTFIKETDLTKAPHTPDVLDIAVLNLTKAILTSADKHIPKLHPPKAGNPFLHLLRSLIRQRDRVRERWKHTRSSDDLDNYHSLCRQVKWAISSWMVQQQAIKLQTLRVTNGTAGNSSENSVPPPEPCLP